MHFATGLAGGGKRDARGPQEATRCNASPDATAASTLVWLQAALTDTCCFLQSNHLLHMPGCLRRHQHQMSEAGDVASTEPGTAGSLCG